MGGIWEELSYGRAGNRTRRICGEEELYRYDRRNRMTAHTRGGVTREFKYDNAGNMLEDGRARYGYDAFNCNTKAETFDGKVQINRYDAKGLRHKMEENGKLVSFIFRGREIVAEESGEHHPCGDRRGGRVCQKRGIPRRQCSEPLRV